MAQPLAGRRIGTAAFRDGRDHAQGRRGDRTLISRAVRRGGLTLLLFAAQGLAAGQDALRGKRLYYDISALTPAPVSCVECHGAYPGAVHGIGRAANEPHAIRYALGAIPQMARLGEHLSAQDIADIAAYLGAPDVPSPQLVLVSDGPGADHGAQGRLEC